MRKLHAFILIGLCFPTLIVTAYPQQNRKKVGVVLSGGGAKGLAHIKALQVIEEAGIPIDLVVGTSMGSIVGGLYAIGYTPNQLDSMVRKQHWGFLLSDRVKRGDLSLSNRELSEKYVLSFPFIKKPKDAISGGFIKGENLTSLFSSLTVGYHDSIDFNRLPIPFACVANDIVTGEQIVFHHGELATVMRASMAIPGVFTPVRLKNMVLVDGGISNNYPADVAKAMGADIIIGVDVQSKLKEANQLNSAPEIIGQIVDITCQSNYQENIDMTDVYIKVNVEGYSSASFTPTAIDTLMKRGEDAARNQWEALLTLKKKIGISQDFEIKPHGPYNPLSILRKIYIKQISFFGVEEQDKKWLMKKGRLEENKETSIQQIELVLNQLRGNQSYSGVSYKLTKTDDGYNLSFFIEEKYEKQINLGVRFDSNEIATLLINGTTRLNTRTPSRVSITGRLGKRYAGRVDYILEPLQQRNITLSYLYQYNDLNIYRNGSRSYNVTYSYHMGDLSLSDVWHKNLRLSAGIRFEYYHYKDFLFRKPEYTINVPSEHFLSYYVQLHYNTFDRGYFPNKGNDFKVSHTIYTDNFLQYKKHTPFSALSLSWNNVIPITTRFSILPSIYSRVLIGRDFPYPYYNILGGASPGMYEPQQLPFEGMADIELLDNALTVASLKFRQRMGSVHYLTLTANCALSNNHFFKTLKSKPIYGGSIAYGLNSAFGPIEFSIGYSNRTQKVNSYINLGFYF